MYRPGKLRRPGPKLLGGSCTPHVLLPLAEQRGSGQSNKIHVESYAEGHLYVDVPQLRGDGSWVRLSVEVSQDTQRWADLCQPPLVTQAGYWVIPLQNLGAYLRVSYQVQGTVQFSVEFVGKSFEVRGNPSESLYQRVAGPRAGHTNHIRAE